MDILTYPWRYTLVFYDAYVCRGLSCGLAMQCITERGERRSISSLERSRTIWRDRGGGRGRDKECDSDSSCGDVQAKKHFMAFWIFPRQLQGPHPYRAQL